MQIPIITHGNRGLVAFRPIARSLTLSSVTAFSRFTLRTNHHLRPYCKWGVDKGCVIYNVATVPTVPEISIISPRRGVSLASAIFRKMSLWRVQSLWIAGETDALQPAGWTSGRWAVRRVQVRCWWYFEQAAQFSRQSLQILRDSDERLLQCFPSFWGCWMIGDELWMGIFTLPKSTKRRNKWFCQRLRADLGWGEILEKWTKHGLLK